MSHEEIENCAFSLQPMQPGTSYIQLSTLLRLVYMRIFVASLNDVEFWCTHMKAQFFALTRLMCDFATEFDTEYARGDIDYNSPRTEQVAQFARNILAAVNAPHNCLARYCSDDESQEFVCTCVEKFAQDWPEWGATVAKFGAECSVAGNTLEILKLAGAFFDTAIIIYLKIDAELRTSIELAKKCASTTSIQQHFEKTLRIVHARIEASEQMLQVITNCEAIFADTDSN